MSIHPAAVAIEQDRPAHAIANRRVDCSPDSGWQRDQGQLRSVAEYPKDTVAMLLAQVIDIGLTGFEYCIPSSPSRATRAKSNGFADVRAATIIASNCRWDRPNVGDSAGGWQRGGALRNAGAVSDLNFRGIAADYYARFRRGYPDLVVDRLVEVLGVDAGSRVLDLGCGSGQLTLPLARHVSVAIGADPEPDMLKLGRHAGLAAGVRNVAWLLAADSDLGALGTLLGAGALDAITIGSAFHWMDCPSLFGWAQAPLKPGGRIAVITNGPADWEQDTPWAQVLREKLAAEYGGPVRGKTGTDEESQRALISALAAADFTALDETIVEYLEERTIEELIGSLYSAMSSDDVERLRAGPFEADLARALADVAVQGSLAAPVQVRILFANTRDERLP